MEEKLQPREFKKTAEAPLTLTEVPTGGYFPQVTMQEYEKHMQDWIMTRTDLNRNQKREIERTIRKRTAALKKLNPDLFPDEKTNKN